MKNEKSKKETISIPPLETETATFKIEGITPLIVNKFSKKAQDQITDGHNKVPKTKRPKDNPEQDAEDSIHYFADKKRTGFPAGGFKGAMLRAGLQKPFEYKMINLTTWFHIMGEEGLVEIKGTPELKTDWRRLANGVMSIVHRSFYKKWEATITVMFNCAAITKEQIAQLINAAGFSCGVGEWRPSSPKNKNGSYGLFKLV